MGELWMQAWADRCGIDITDERVQEASIVGWPEKFKDWKNGWDAAIRAADARSEALESCVSALRDACHATAIYGDEPPQMYLDAIDKAERSIKHTSPQSGQDRATAPSTAVNHAAGPAVDVPDAPMEVGLPKGGMAGIVEKIRAISPATTDSLGLPAHRCPECGCRFPAALKWCSYCRNDTHNDAECGCRFSVTTKAAVQGNASPSGVESTEPAPATPVKAQGMPSKPIFYDPTGKRSSWQSHRYFIQACDYDELRAYAERVADALRFYADETSWKERNIGALSYFAPAIRDGGDNARRALSGGKHDG